MQNFGGQTKCIMGDVEMANFKGLGHTIVGNFGTDQMVIELTKISK